jgi:hypothetical protein
MKHLLFLSLVVGTSTFASGFSRVLLECTSISDSDIYVSCMNSTSAPGGPIRTWYTWGKKNGTLLSKSKSPIKPNPSEFDCVKPEFSRRCPITGSP